MAGTFIYFAYGSNMLLRRLKERAPSAKAIGVGFVKGHRLTFDKVSKDKSGNFSGKCDMEATANLTEKVHGVLFRISNAEKNALDKAEAGYSKCEFEVITSASVSNAIAYVADNKDPHLLPYHWYKALVIAGAEEHDLPKEYVAQIQKVNSQPDPNIERRLKNEAIL